MDWWKDEYFSRICAAILILAALCGVIFTLTALTSRRAPVRAGERGCFYRTDLLIWVRDVESIQGDCKRNLHVEELIHIGIFEESRQDGIRRVQATYSVVQDRLTGETQNIIVETYFPKLLTFLAGPLLNSGTLECAGYLDFRKAVP